MATQLLGASGDTTTSSITNGYIVLSKFTASDSGLMTLYKIKCTTSGNVKVGLYADSSGSPGSLINSAASSVVSGWNSISFPSSSISSGTAYWLAMNSDTNNLVCWQNIAADETKYKALTYTDSFPNPAGSGYTDTTWGMMVQGWKVGIAYDETYTEVITIVESIIRSESRVLSDVVTLVESILKNITRTLTTDVVTIADTISKQGEKVLSDTVIIAEYIAKSVGKVISDTLTIAESLIKSIQRTLSDTISISDTIEKILNYIGRLPSYIRALVSPKPTGFSNDKDKPGIGTARSVDKPQRL